jgi:hypothetical protein
LELGTRCKTKPEVLTIFKEVGTGTGTGTGTKPGQEINCFSLARHND